MCGIVGYIGPKPAQSILISGLKRMEYRGYDSAGIALLASKKVVLTRAEGKLANLVSALGAPSKATIGIGHTRWATHGAPTKRNAHPHRIGKITLVHNGIIENYKELKEELEKEGVTFASETDSEILAGLIDHNYQKLQDLHQAVEAALARVRGTFGVVVMCDDFPAMLVAARRGSPLIVGTHDDEIFVASDATALVGYARDVLYLDDDEIAVCEGGRVEVFNFERQPQAKTAEELKLELKTIQKQGYDHFLLKEIMEQPESVRGTMRGHVNPDEGAAHLGGVKLDDRQIRQIQRIQIIGCGTAFHAGLLSKYLLEKMTDIPVDVEIASEFRYREPVLTGGTVGIIISQSGETADTLASLRELQRKGVYAHGLVNAVGSTIARETDGGMYLHVGPEISVASTKAFTSQVVGQLLFGLYIARKRTLSLPNGQEVVEALSSLPDDIARVLKLNDRIKRLAKKVAAFDHAMFMGRDTLYPIALEGALKLKEISYIQAEAYAAGEMKHGPISLIDDSFLTVFLLGKGRLFEKSRTNLEEVRARGGTTIVFTDHEEYAKKDEDAIYVPTGSSWTAPLVMNVPLQLLAYHTAVVRGTDVDQPRNLAKSVTVE